MLDTPMNENRAARAPRLIWFPAAFLKGPMGVLNPSRSSLALLGRFRDCHLLGKPRAYAVET
ncbi:MAG: hypothetical protein VXY07_16990 [Planctomycetota bacterium]|nr:hypothetical protein [Planctomycetota bacterium]MEC7446676.1 hypothetical protein [Planctomycetota bacterium]MEC7499191.1 hypothetical protein [Planctomycetota bacterium]MEC7603691.1 hypothetical protein [Planctomycetota bacterium]MEC7718141.1 hypothetical protein [Planctomycetota bacterium]